MFSTLLLIGLLHLEFVTSVTLVTSVTVEEGKAAVLTCPGFVSNPEHEHEKYAIFHWFKASQSNLSDQNRVAFYDKADGVQNSLGDLLGRATIDGKTGALEIPQTTVSDDHFYPCKFQYTASGDILNETRLVITVTPSENDLKVTASPPGPVREGTSVTFKCSAARVKPLPKEMFWKFTDDDNQHPGQYKNETNSDNLTSSVSVEYTMAINVIDNGRKLNCYYVTAAGNTIISSQEVTVKALYKPSGQPNIRGDKKAVKVNSKFTLTCDATSVNGSITWYQWLFANGNELGNTTEKNWTYTANSSQETLQFVCIAGNAAGQSAKSSVIDIEVQSVDSSNTSKPDNLVLIIGVVIGCALAVIFIIIGICFFIRRRKLNDPKLEPEIQVTVNYNQMSDGGELIYAQPIKKQRRKNKQGASNGEYANGNLGDDKTVTEDGLIYMQPEFLNQGGALAPPQPRGNGPKKPPKPATKPRQVDYTPTEYGEVDFNKMAEMKKK